MLHALNDVKSVSVVDPVVILAISYGDESSTENEAPSQVHYILQYTIITGSHTVYVHSKIGKH